MIDDCLREGGFDPTREGSLLDFGSGCGRILQFFALYAATVELHGADVDAEAVAWCAKHLDFARFEVLGPQPPSPFEARRFDAVFAFSVFSLLPEELHGAWLDEIARITKPGAAVVLTTQGHHVVDELMSRRANEFPPPELLAKRLPELERTGFAFFPYRRLRFRDPENVAHFEEWDLERYGSTFILEPYIRRHWTRHFDLVAHHAAPDDWQDYVVLRRRSGGP
jgi:SAM-dependent methyltransferase